jgi:N-acetylmuramoyl-L-alanine amidase
MAIKKLALFMVHCAATKANPKLSGDDVRRWHTDPVSQGGRGWAVPGYSMVIRTDGTIDSLVKYNEDAWVEAGEITNGAAGYNGVTRHVCYIGGLDEHGKYADTRTAAQKKVLEGIIKRAIAAHPDIKVCGHYQVQPAKPFCPGFDMPHWLRSIGVAEKNIYRA